MKKNSSLAGLVILGLIMSLASLGLTQTNLYYSYSTLPGTPSAPPSYSLGNIPPGTTLTINIRLLSVFSGADTSPAAMNIYLMDATNQDILADLGSEFSCSGQTCKIVYKTTNVTDGYLYLQISAVDNTLETLQYIMRYEVDVSQNATLIFKGTDILRDHIDKYIYINQPRNVTFSLSPDVNGTNLSPLIVTPTSSADQFCLQCGTGAVTPTTISNLNGIDYFTYFLPAGYYAIQSPNSGEDTINLRYLSDPYACPYDPNYPDIYSVFLGCTAASTSSAALPCVSFNTILQACSACLQGYYLANGTCYVNITCQPNQYLHFGQCINANPLCATFDAITGACLSCYTYYNLVNGACVHVNVTCLSNQYQVNFTCYNVSSSCATFNSTNGNCLTCIYGYVLSGAQCSPIVVTCTSRQYVLNFTCVDIDPTCQTFDVSILSCTSCVFGYYVSNGACVQIQCPPRQVPSKYGLFCVSVSPLCGNYDSMTGYCLTCSQNGMDVQPDGTCAQAISPLAGCMERQTLGFGPCVGAQLNCAVYNLNTGDCTSCNTGYYLAYTGTCKLMASCSSRQYQINGNCYDVSPNCNTFDSTNGLCTSCITGLQNDGGVCIPQVTCAAQQYLNQNNVCVNVSPTCATWNPSSGLCLSCVDPTNVLNDGICCPAGQVSDGGVCALISVVGTAAATQTGPSCAVVHPTLGYCLSCNPGYQLSSFMYGTCVSINIAYATTTVGNITTSNIPPL